MKLLQVFSRVNFYLGVDFSQIIEFIHVFCYLFLKKISKLIIQLLLLTPVTLRGGV